jgi:glycosyltransferase involved in cell wall biosynthesis
VHLPPFVFSDDFAGWPSSPTHPAKSFLFDPEPALSPRRIVLVANTAWNLWNFRSALIRLLLERGHEVVCIAPPDGYEGRLLALGVARFLPLAHFSRKSLSPLGNLRSFAELAGLLRRERPDCALLYTVKPNIFGALAARWSRIPAIASVEGVGYAGTASSPLRWLVFGLYRLAFRSVQRVVFLNHDDSAEFLHARVLPPSKLQVIRGTGIDTGRFGPGLEPGRWSGGPVFLFIGRLLSDKGIREFVRAARLVRRSLPEARFQILGSPDDGNPASIPTGELHDWSRDGAVEYLGYDDDVRPFIAAADVVVLPSYREGMPRVLLEGMAMAKPIITTSSVGCRDTVEDGRNGFIVPSENASALAEAFHRFARLDPGQRRAMGAYSRRKVVAEFSNAVVLPRYMKLLEEVLVGRKG